MSAREGNLIKFKVLFDKYTREWWWEGVCIVLFRTADERRKDVVAGKEKSLLLKLVQFGLV